MTSSEEITREWPYTKALYNYADYFVDFAADSISKHARRPLPTDMVAMKEAKPFGASNGPNCVAARHCRVDLFEAEFVSAANTVGRKMVVEMQQQQKDAAASGTALPAEHAAILALASKASMKRKLFKYEAYDAYLCVQDVGTFGVGLQIRTRFQPSCPNVHQDCATFKVQKFVAASNQFVVCFTGQRFLEATGNAVLAYWKERTSAARHAAWVRLRASLRNPSCSHWWDPIAMSSLSMQRLLDRIVSSYLTVQKLMKMLHGRRWRESTR